MAAFLPAYHRTHGFEGVYSNDPADAGGETYAGISRRAHPGWPGWRIIDDLRPLPDLPARIAADTTLPRLAQQFYRMEYWIPLQGDDIRSQAVAEELYDTAVNQGVDSAVEYLQEALNCLNRQERLYGDCAVDGVMGPQTLAALEAYYRTDSDHFLLVILNGLQLHRYITILRRDPTQERFIRGWLKRVVIQRT